MRFYDSHGQPLNQFLMKTHPFQLVIAGFACLAINASATVLYVDLNSTDPTPPYADWSTAATTIQDAIDASSDSDQILITNGVYQTGGRVIYGSLTNRVAVTRTVTVQSVNGPEVTVIQGYQVPGTTNGDSAVRCVYLTNGATLAGFTLTNGATRDAGEWTYEQLGGGVWCEDVSAVVSNCILTGNAAITGAGAYSGSLSHCTLAGGVANEIAGGAIYCTLNDSVLSGNTGLNYCGAAYGSTLNRCAVSNNYGFWGAGGVYECTLSDCTLSGNQAAEGGAADGSALTNCVLFANTATFESAGGAINSTLVNCKLIGNVSAYSGGGACQSILNHCTLSANTAYYGGGADNSALNDCVLSNNTATAGFPAAAVSSRASPQRPAPASGGGASWSTLTHCTLAVNQADGAGGGAYVSTLDQCMVASNLAEYGGGADSCTLSNCVLTGNSAIEGGGAANCELLVNCTLDGNSAGWLGGGASWSFLNSCLLTNNTSYFDGGASECTLNNCTILNNFADADSAAAENSTLNNCIVSGNHSSVEGLTAWYCTFNNCTIVGNSAGVGGCALNNCILYYTGDTWSMNTFNYCCTTPLPDSGVGNITNEPSLLDPEGGDFHLLKNSPCINSGNNAYITNSTDLDGNPRIAGGTVDIGAYEFQWPMSVISYAWLQQYDLSTGGSDDYADTDGDGMDNWKEWRTGTIPTDASSVLKMTAVAGDVSGMTATWQSVTNRTYFLQRSGNLTADPAFETVATDIPGQPDTTSYTDTDATGDGPYFYRVGVQ
jgi:hypothetical protein